MKPGTDNDSESKQQSHPLRNAVIAVVVLMVLYVLSIGPAEWLTSRGFVSGRAWGVAELRLASHSSAFLPDYPPMRVVIIPGWAIYKPLCQAYISSPGNVQAAFDKYLDWWRG